MREPEYPHPFEPWGFGVCKACGLDEDDPIPAQCPHDYAQPCTTCPRAHTPPARSAGPGGEADRPPA